MNVVDNLAPGKCSVDEINQPSSEVEDMVSDKMPMSPGTVAINWILKITFAPALSREFRPYKPDPAPLLHICSIWEVLPNEVMMIGDSLKDDVYPNMRSAFVDIIQTCSFRGLYAGLSPMLVEIVPYAGLQFGTYHTFKRWAMAWNQMRSSGSVADDSLSSFQLFICGLAAGTCAKAVRHPLDVVKKRFQV
ncbi:hypothetical protein U1Q18_038034 [Sarracenia purpurea var. burkii]